jgi:glyceraldehyde 3-phosphate dehydrogenase
MMKIGISGTGRIGRLLLRRAFSSSKASIQVEAINTTSSVEALLHLLRYDSIHGFWGIPMEAAEGGLLIDGKFIAMFSEREPERIPWHKNEIELVIDATGKFNHRSGSSIHLLAGAKKVIITAPGTDMDATIVMGVNEQHYQPDKHALLSTASCTTNCLAPILSILDQYFQVERGWMTTIHAYTSDQNLLDNPHKDLRRARSSTASMIPTSTGISKALAHVLPHLAPHFHGISIRVPVQDVSLIDLNVQLGRTTDIEEVRATFRSAIQGPIGSVVDYNELPLVSSDYIGNEKSAIIDGLSIMVQQNQLKLLAWYDNEWAYACRVIDFASYVVKQSNSFAGGRAHWMKQSV